MGNHDVSMCIEHPSSAFPPFKRQIKFTSFGLYKKGSATDVINYIFCGIVRVSRHLWSYTSSAAVFFDLLMAEEFQIMLFVTLKANK
jgi:hypothetical protein